MATSGSYDYARTRDQIITRALRLLGAVPQGDTPRNEQINEGAEALEGLIKNLQGKGIGLWAREMSTKRLAASSEVTGTDSEVYTCVLGHTGVAATNKPITGTDWSLYWKKKGSTGGVWATSAYVAIGDWALSTDTLEVDEAYLHRDDTDHPLEIISYKRYLREYSSKWTTGLPQIMAVNHLLDTPHAHMYPQSDAATDVVHYQRYRKLDDFDAAGNNPDAPAMWIDTLTFALARRLAPEYGTPIHERRDLGNQAQRMLKDVMGGDVEEASELFIESAF